MKKGDRVRCIDPEPAQGTGLALGSEYLVTRVFKGNQRPDELPIPGMSKTPGCCLKEVPAHFVQSRFEVLP